MKKLEMVFADFDMYFRIMLKKKRAGDNDLVFNIFTRLDAVADTLDTLSLISKEEYYFIKKAIQFVWLEEKIDETVCII